MTESTKDDHHLALRAKASRLARGMTLAQLSARSGISVGHLSRLENAERAPTVRILIQLADALGVTLSDLVGESSTDSDIFVARATEARDGRSESPSHTPLSHPGSQILRAFELRLEPGRVGEPVSHAGEEWIYALEGSVDVMVGSSITPLSAGDAMQFNATHAHCLRNPHSTSARVLVVATTGLLGDTEGH
jgi:transcriptional regulator with XRE-family HTH domain